VTVVSIPGGKGLEGKHRQPKKSCVARKENEVASGPTQEEGSCLRRGQRGGQETTMWGGQEEKGRPAWRQGKKTAEMPSGRPARDRARDGGRVLEEKRELFHGGGRGN